MEDVERNDKFDGNKLEKATCDIGDGLSLSSGDGDHVESDAGFSASPEKTATDNMTSGEEIDVDTLLYYVSDLDDSNSDISFNDVPELLTTDDDPQSETTTAIMNSSNKHSSENKMINDSVLSKTELSRPLKEDEALGDVTDTIVGYSSEDNVYEDIDSVLSATALTKSPIRNDDNGNSPEMDVTGDASVGNPNEVHENLMGKYTLPSSRDFTDNDDSVLDTNSTDGSSSSRHKEVLIDYRRSLHRRNSASSDGACSTSSSVDFNSYPGSYDSGLPNGDAAPLMSKYLVVAAIDFGTTYSGYAFAFTRDPDNIHMMRRWEGGDPGVSNQKTPTTLLLTPDKKFHSFGFGARDFYHDLEPSDAKKYYYFEKFKMKLYNSEGLSENTEIKAANGKSIKAIDVFSYSLRFFKEHVLEELSDQLSTKLMDTDICWVITVPAIWKAGAKQFMRKATYKAGLTDFDNPERVIIALEPEAASIFCRKLRLRDCVLDEIKKKSVVGSMMDWQIGNEFEGKTKYVVVDCGGGTVDLTVHELDSDSGALKELHKGTGGPCGATGVDVEFEKLLKKIFGKDFIEQFKNKRPAGWVDLMIAFEAKKRNSSPSKNNWLNLALPFSFIDYYKKHHKTSSIESAVRKHNNPYVKWSSQGMLRLAPEVMDELFKPVLKCIVEHVNELLSNANVNDVKFLFLVGGFAESPLLQHEIRRAFSSQMRVIIPNEVGLTILKGAVLFGLDPTVIRVRRSALTYGVGVLNKFIPGTHPRDKIVRKNGVMWCTDVFDKFVTADQPITLGDKVIRSYAPARAGQTSTTLNVYCTEEKEVEFITDASVRRCGHLKIEMPEVQGDKQGKPRELQATMTFWDTEIKVSGMDVRTGKEARARIDFLSN